MTEQSAFVPPDSEAQRALEREAQLPLTGWQQEVSKGLEYGLEAAHTIKDRTIPTFSRGELPHYAGINTFLKAPYLEDVRQVGKYDVAIVGIVVPPTARVLALAPRESAALVPSIPPTILNWGSIYGNRLPSAMSAIFLPFLLIMRSPLIKFPKVSPMFLVPVLFRFC
ncbi:MAG: hypothetical protein RLZZ148_529 [Cyanobacteriota bacterium]